MSISHSLRVQKASLKKYTLICAYPKIQQKRCCYCGDESEKICVEHHIEILKYLVCVFKGCWGGKFRTQMLTSVHKGEPYDEDKLSWKTKT